MKITYGVYGKEITPDEGMILVERDYEFTGRFIGSVTTPLSVDHSIYSEVPISVKEDWEERHRNEAEEL